MFDSRPGHQDLFVSIRTKWYSIGHWPGGEVGKSLRGRLLPEVLDRSVTWTNKYWPGGEVVTLRSAKPTYTSSILVLASKERSDCSDQDENRTVFDVRGYYQCLEPENRGQVTLRNAVT